jgi:hypothetical protein
VTRHGWQVDLTGLVQVDSVAWSQASVDELDPGTSQPLNEQRFVIPRARLRAEVHRDAVSAAIELDGNTLNGAVSRLLGAHVRWTYAPGAPEGDPPVLAVTAGLFTIPFGVEVAADVREKPFLEPPAMSRALFPGNFDAGVMAAGSYGLDDLGRFGAPATVDLVANAAPPPAGELVIGLDWDGVADLDLHVLDPLGGEAWSDDPNTWVPPPPGEPVDPTAYLTGGILDHDGNANCHRDGRPAEHVIWRMPPPAGTYLVRVDARSMCGGPAAAWYVAAYRNATLLSAARGVATGDDVQQPHGAGAGVLALRFAL